LGIVVCGLFGTPARALAQTDKWEVDVAPLYFWAAKLDGDLAVNDRSRPIFMSFDDALDKLAGAFAVDVGARKGRWGVLADVNFVRLSTDTTFTLPVVQRPVTGTAKLDQVMFEGGVSYLVRPGTNFNLIGGLRTYTLSPRLTFSGTTDSITPVDTSATAVGGFGGFTFRPKLTDKLTFLSRADIGGGEALTWTAMLGVNYRFTSWAGAIIGYRALGIDTGNVTTDNQVVTDLGYSVIHYGPIVSLTFHWTQK